MQPELVRADFGMERAQRWICGVIHRQHESQSAEVRHPTLRARNADRSYPRCNA